MTGEPVEHRAARMLAAYQRIAAKMYTLDAHSGRRFLRDGRLSGTTAEVAERVKTDASNLWTRFNEVRRLADRIPAHPEQLGKRALAELDELLTAECVETDADGLPAYGSGQPVASVLRLVDFADRVEADCAELLELCERVDFACGDVADAAAEITARLDAAAALAETLGTAGDPVLADLRAQRTDALSAALTDPLAANRTASEAVSHRDDAEPLATAADPGAQAKSGPDPVAAASLTALAERVDAFHRRLIELDAADRDFPQRLAGVRDRLAKLARTETRAAEACDLAARKILAPPPPRYAPAAERLATELRSVEERAGQADRHGAASQFAAVTSRLDQAERECRRVTDTATALLDRRTELRGRLAAYTRKAARIGVIEEPRVAASAQVASEILALAPCDLRSATKAVREFQHVISGAQEAPA